MVIQSGHTLRSLSIELGKCASFLSVILKRDSLSPRSAKEICDFLGKDFNEIFLISVSSNGDRRIA